jgi:hypothetical protein
VPKIVQVIAEAVAVVHKLDDSADDLFASEDSDEERRRLAKK